MYTPNITAKSFDKDQNQILLTVDFSDGTNTVTRQMRFGGDFTFDAIKRNLKLVASMLDAGATNVATISTGEIDLTTVSNETRTAQEIAAADWLRNFERLQKVQVLVDLGILTGNETAVVNLRNKLSTDFKPAYINLF